MENLGMKRQEKERDEYLNMLWDDYGFPGKPPFKESAAEKRLKSTCEAYSVFIDSGTDSSESARRVLHNELALMCVGAQRSGMDITMAENISQFAYEYAKGYKVSEKEKFKRN
jgi:hypothetical protein